ncbi:MAG: A/G-specific adenine glycosylase [Spirochaetota bacterium]
MGSNHSNIKTTRLMTEIEKFKNTVYDYYTRNGRTLPWRCTKDPYKILVSEVMLQQTQVQRVMEKYSAFIERFPTVQRLAQAPLRDVMQSWQGLGYNRRALALWKLAALVVERYKGRLPDEHAELTSLPGIGNATAGAICVFAFNKPVVFVETNIRSVFLHHFFAQERVVSDNMIIPLVRDTLDHHHPRKWYTALMDYGTHLKKQFGNPNQRSTSYHRQSAFHGSDREARGMVLKIVLETQGCSEQVLVNKTDLPSARLRPIINTLLQEGLIRKQRGQLTV